MSSSEFTFRQVYEHELSEWGALCGKAFAHRSGRPERFLEKYLADPTRSLEGLRVAVSMDGRLASTVRVFARSMRFGQDIVPVGGIGEVCTDPAFRGKGLAKRVMNDALDYIDNVQKAWVSVLDSADGLEQYYGSFGYRSVPLYYSMLRIPVSGTGMAQPVSSSMASSSGTRSDRTSSPQVEKTNRRLAHLWRSVMGGSDGSDASANSSAAQTAPGSESSTVYEATAKELGDQKVVIRKVDISEHVFDLSTLYDAYSEGFYGVLMRSHAYWREFVSYKLGENGIWAAFAPNESDGTESMIAYIAVTEKRGSIKIAEYGCKKSLQNSSNLFETLARVGVVNVKGIDKIACDQEGETVDVECPKPVLARLNSLDLPVTTETTVGSWMYRLHPRVQEAKVSRKAVHPSEYINKLSEAAEDMRHVVWFTDKF
eukprot:gb/GECG01005865.1/.p1 GENE.gb/GECG01005865.1/~~gb/GECG01005865.1/.p1  ORF type:complete len:428 (+),score=44.58 gb/GECG01005865.1/:1-1284(+)